MDYAALAVSGLALGFTLASFWWLHAHAGTIVAAIPRSYAFVESPFLRLPLVFYNTGARALIVCDLRVVATGAPGRPPLEWQTTRSTLRPGSEDGHTFATPFAIPGRATREVIAEFGGHDGWWRPQAASMHPLRVEALVHPSQEWREVTAFDWWAPESSETMHQYIAHRNAPSSSSLAAPG